MGMRDTELYHLYYHHSNFFLTFLFDLNWFYYNLVLLLDQREPGISIWYIAGIGRNTF